ncbi:MAG: helix-turn-helix domain-containing protein [Ilumatobacteraceae bacterium]
MARSASEPLSEGDPRRSAATPEASGSLIAAAERLFAARGIDGVSLREINREAQQRNTTSLQYHFGDREGLLRAILAKHGREIDARRNALLDQYDANRTPDIRVLASAFILPLVAKLHDPDGGRAYLRIAAELVNRSNRRIEPTEPSILNDPGGRNPRDSITRWSSLVGPLLPPRVIGPPLHRRYAAMRFAHIELGRRACEGSHQSDRLFTSHLVDLLVSVLVTDVSDETEALLQEREQQRAARVARRAAAAAAAKP